MANTTDIDTNITDYFDEYDLNDLDPDPSIFLEPSKLISKN